MFLRDESNNLLGYERHMKLAGVSEYVGLVGTDDENTLYFLFVTGNV